MTSIEQILVNRIVDYRIYAAQLDIPRGHCHQAYYSLDGVPACGSLDCDECRKTFFQLLRNEIYKEEIALVESLHTKFDPVEIKKIED